MTTDNSKRDYWEEVERERLEKEEREWKYRHAVDQLKDDYPNLIPPSRYDKIFISQIGETEFIVDDDDIKDHFSIYDVKPDSSEIGKYYDEYYKNEIGITKIYTNDQQVPFSDDPSLYVGIWSEILEKVRNNDGWIPFSQENRDWLKRQDELFTPVEEEHNRKVEEDIQRRLLNREFRDELQRRRMDGDKSVLEYDSLDKEYTSVIERYSNPNDIRTFDYDGSSFENELKKRIDYLTKIIKGFSSKYEVEPPDGKDLFDLIYLEED